MTDKQIIIDGMDCRYWFRPNPTDYRKCSLRGQDDNCDEIKDCFVKELLNKLSRKEQECEELKNEYWKLEQGNDFLAEKNSKLKGCLTEIKEIAEKTLNMVDYKTYFKRDNKSLKQEGFKAIDQILQKISECEGNDETN